MSLAFSFVDLLVVLVILGSAAYATWRGFVSETLSIVAWAVAALASLYLGPWVARLAQALIATAWIATVVGYAAVFVAIFIPLQFASHRFSEGVRRSPVGPLDRVLGATFGIVRGLAILGIAYLIFTAFVPIREQPRWLLEARTLPLIQSSSEVLLALVPERDRHEAAPPPAAGPKPERIEDLLPRPAPAVHPLRPRPPKKHGKKGYGAGDRHALDRLFETTGSGGTQKP
ncbi:MAG TPA: CvpA family protein [Rhizomicrobium sp.]|jgi:membrane protein required for colicin V production|nr:CvpA family protein [Rhizomicrobium sp.]